MKIEVYADKEKGENCWGWRLKIDGKEVAHCTKFLTKEENRNSIKQIQAKVSSCSLGDLQIEISDSFPAEMKNEIAHAEVVYECPEDDPAHEEKQKDTTETKGMPGSHFS